MMFTLDGNEPFYNEGNEKKEIETEVKKFAQKIQTNIVDRINSYLKNIGESTYAEESEDYTAYGALIKNEANCDGIIEAFGAILTELQIQFQILKFTDSEFTGIKVNNKIYSPYVEKLCERNSVSFKEWVKDHM